MSFWKTIGMMFFLILVAGCQSDIDLDTPPEFFFGQDVCIYCGMIITEKRYAAAYMTNDRDIRLFDDIGGMISYNRVHQESVHKFWVHDYHDENIFDANQGFFVINDKITSPMDYGIIAFLNYAQAASVATEYNTEILHFKDLLNIDLNKN